MRVLKALLAALTAGYARSQANAKAPAVQVASLQPDLKVSLHWENVWGIVQIVFLPGGKVMTVQKTGELRVYDQINKKANEYRKMLDISEEVYSWWDHGLLSAAVHPEFPKQPYVYISYSAEYPGKPWNDQCYPDPKKEYLVNPPDTRPYCRSMARLVRLKVDLDFTRATIDNTMMEDWCTSTYTHHVGTINFLADGSMLYGAGDGSHFQGIDYGSPLDECTIANGPRDQGVFLSQKDGYLRGKFIKIRPDALLKTGKITPDEYTVLSKGHRNPFRSTVDPNTGDVYIGDVGSSVWEEINFLPNPLKANSVVNFGWPCIEGKDYVSDIYQNWLRQQGLLSTCADPYAGRFTRPVFQYRYGAVDPDFPDKCADADASVSGITVYTGDKLPERYRNKIFWVDYSKKCGFWFDKKPDGTFDFSHAHAFTAGAKGLPPGGFTDVKTGPDGYLYIADYSGGKLWRVLDAKDTTGGDLNVTTPDNDSSISKLGLWLETSPTPYQWAYGDKVTYNLHSKVPLDPKNVTWRVTNGHCVYNPCTTEYDCHQHEISLSAESRTGLSGVFSPSPHPMESFITITAMIQQGDDQITKEFITHATTFNLKIGSDPQGFPLMLEESTCSKPPCVVAVMGGTNPTYTVQNINSLGDQLYKFVGFTATDVATGQVKIVNATAYEEVAVADTEVVANYVPVASATDPAIGAPEGVTVSPDVKKVTVNWTPTKEGGPDFVVVTLKSQTDTISRAVPSGSKQVTMDVPDDAVRYAASVAFYDSRVSRKGMHSTPLMFMAAKPASKGNKAAEPGSSGNCGDGDAGMAIHLKRPSKPQGRFLNFALGLVGNYPTQIEKNQKAKVTMDVISSVETKLLINVLQKDSFDWVGGTVVTVPAGKAGLLSVPFTITGDVVDGGDYFIHALLVDDPKDYESAYVDDKSTLRILGLADKPFEQLPKPAATLTPPAGVAVPTAPAADAVTATP